MKLKLFRKEYRPSVLHTGRALLLLTVVLGLWLYGFIFFASQIPAPRNDFSGLAPAQAIIVFTGGKSRLSVALNMLAARKGRQLFISGVHRGVDLFDLLRAYRTLPVNIDCCVILGHNARNTAENMNESRFWLEQKGYRSVILVTSSYHMPRSLLYMRKALPEVEIIAHPVLGSHFSRPVDWFRTKEPLLLALSEYHKYLWAHISLWAFPPHRRGGEYPPFSPLSR